MDAGNAEFAQLLARRRDALTESLRSLSENVRELAAARGTETADDEHDPEGATLSTEWSRIEGLRAGATRELADIDAARARVDAGTYGICTGCGRRIPVERLRVRPMSTTCVSCAETRR